ncbi:MAG: hypothetical protein ACI4HQ_03910 [Acetatifactor sp.]
MSYAPPEIRSIFGEMRRSALSYAPPEMQSIFSETEQEQCQALCGL